MKTDAENILLDDLTQKRSKTGREVGNREKRQQRKINLPWAFYVIILDGSETPLKDGSVVSDRIKEWLIYKRETIEQKDCRKNVHSKNHLAKIGE